MICITEEAAELLKKMISESDSGQNRLTIMSSGAGCGSPKLKLEMRPPLEDDIISETGGFTFHIRKNIEKFLDEADIDAEDTYWGKKLQIKTAFGCS